MFIVNFLQVASFAFIAEYLRPRFFAFSKLMKKSVARLRLISPASKYQKRKWPRRTSRLMKVPSSLSQKKLRTSIIITTWYSNKNRMSLPQPKRRLRLITTLINLPSTVKCREL